MEAAVSILALRLVSVAKTLNLTGNIPGRTKLLHKELHSIVCRWLISKPQLNSNEISQEDILQSSLVSDGLSHHPIINQ